MNGIYYELNIVYAIARKNMDNDTYEYFDGCDMLGRDKYEIICLRRTKWISDLKKCSLNPKIERVNQILKGILKYDSESNYKYYILEVKTTARISKYIEVNI